MRPLLLAIIVIPLTGLVDEHAAGIVLNQTHALKWQAGPPSRPKGAQIAVLDGDPNKEGPFVFTAETRNTNRQIEKRR
jgi:hypothetical protein